MERMQIETSWQLWTAKKWLANTTKWPPLQATTWHAWAKGRGVAGGGRAGRAGRVKEREQILPQIFQAKAHKSLIRSKSTRRRGAPREIEEGAQWVDAMETCMKSIEQTDRRQVDF